MSLFSKNPKVRAQAQKALDNEQREKLRKRIKRARLQLTALLKALEAEAADSVLSDLNTARASADAIEAAHLRLAEAVQRGRRGV